MRNMIFEWVTHLTLVTQVASPLAGLITTAPHVAFASAETVPSTSIMHLDATAANPVVVQVNPAPNFDTEVLAPLRAAQAAADAAAKAAEAARVAAAKRAAIVEVKTAPAAVMSVDVATGLGLIRMCESGSVYTRNSGNGYYGAYQYNLGTWANYGGYERPDLAPASVQDAKAASDVAARGYSPWANCARKNGLM